MEATHVWHPSELCTGKQITRTKRVVTLTRRSSLGYVEAVVVADSLKRRANGLENVDLHNNLLST